jgi:hypothetical protein
VIAHQVIDDRTLYATVDYSEESLPVWLWLDERAKRIPILKEGEMQPERVLTSAGEAEVIVDERSLLIAHGSDYSDQPKSDD